MAQATRRQQPYRKGSGTRSSGLALQAMSRGKQAYGPHPMHARRQAAKRHKRHKSGGVASLAIRY